MREEPSGSGKSEPAPEVSRARSRSGPRARTAGLIPDRATAVVYAISLTGILANTLVTPVLPEIRDHFGLSQSEVGLMVSLASLPGIVIAPLVGIVSDRVGRRATVIPCLVVFGLGGLLGMLAPSYSLLLAARLFQGFGAAGLINLAVVILGDRHEGAERARAIGRNAAAITVGLAVLPAVGGALGEIGGWRASFAPYVAAFGVAAVAAVVLPPDAPSGPPVPLRATFSGARPYLFDRRVAAMAPVGFLVFFMVFGLVLTALPTFLADELGLGEAARGLVLGTPAAASVVVALAMGKLAMRFGTWEMVAAGLACFAVAFCALAAGGGLVPVVAAALVYGVGEGLTIVPLQAYSASIAPVAYRGVVVGVWVAAVRAGQSSGPWMVGRSLESLSYGSVFLAGAVVSLALGAVVVTVRRLLHER